MKLVSKKEVGQRRVYDIEVAGVHNFFANGVNVHNCATDEGVSVIKSDGTVVNITSTSASDERSRRIGFLGSDLIFEMSRAGDGANGAVIASSIPAVSTDTSALLNRRQYKSGYAPTTFGTTSLSIYRDLERPGIGPLPLKNSTFAADRYSVQAGIALVRENPSDPAKGMVAYSTIAYASAWLPGDIRLAAITAADGVSETLVGAELVTNGTFDVDTAGWSPTNGGILSVADGKLRVEAANAAYTDATQTISTVAGKSYRLTATGTHGTGRAWFYDQGALSYKELNAPASVMFVASGASTTITLRLAGFGGGIPAVGVYADYDNISVREVIADRSVKNNGLVINGSLTKAPVAAGAGLCALSGFSAANYLEQPYSSNHDYALAAFAFLVPLKEAPNTVDEVVFERAYYTAGAYSGARIRLEVLAAGTLKATFSDGTNIVTLTSTAAVDDSVWRTGLVVGFDGTNFRMVAGGGQDLATPVARSAVGSLNNANAVLRVGLGVDGNAPLTNGAITLFRATAMWPSADQIRHVFESEKKLFEPGAQCAIAGTSNAVTALAYDEETDLLHVGTSWGRSAFQNLVRVSSEATPVGSIKALAASGGAVVQVGATATDIYIPAYSLREELERLDDAARALGSVPVFHEFDAIAAQTDFVVPAGFRVVAVYSVGALKRVGSTKDYVVLDDSFRKTVRFAVAPGAGAWVSVMTVRGN